MKYLFLFLVAASATIAVLFGLYGQKLLAGIWVFNTVMWALNAALAASRERSEHG